MSDRTPYRTASPAAVAGDPPRPVQEPRGAAPDEGHRVVPGPKGLRLTAQRPGQPPCNGHSGLPCRLQIARAAPPYLSGPSHSRRAWRSGEVGEHKRREVHAGTGARMVPEVEARVHLQKMERPVRCTLEVELRHPPQAEQSHNLTAAPGDVLDVGDPQRGRVAAVARTGPQLVAGELPLGLAAVAEVDVVALDPALGAADVLLRHEGPDRRQLGPQGSEHVRRVDAQCLAGGLDRLPEPVAAVMRLDDERKAEVGQVGWWGGGIGPKDAGGGDRERERLGQRLEPDLVREDLDRLGVGDDEAERLRQQLRWRDTNRSWLFHW